MIKSNMTLASWYAKSILNPAFTHSQQRYVGLGQQKHNPNVIGIAPIIFVGSARGSPCTAKSCSLLCPRPCSALQQSTQSWRRLSNQRITITQFNSSSSASATLALKKEPFCLVSQSRVCDGICGLRHNKLQPSRCLQGLPNWHRT